MQKSEVVTTLAKVLDDVNKNIIDTKPNEKQGSVKKHHKEACKGCDGICCTKKKDKDGSASIEHKI